MIRLSSRSPGSYPNNNITREGSCPGTLQQRYENTLTKEGELDIVKSKDATDVALNNLLEVKPDAVE